LYEKKEFFFDRPSGYDDERIETARSISFQKTFRSKRVTKINDNERIGGGGEGVKGREGKG